MILFVLFQKSLWNVYYPPLKIGIDVGSQRELAQERLNAVLASLRFDSTYAEMQGAFANVYASVGLDAFDGQMTGNESVDELASSLRSLWHDRGDKG